MRDLSSYFYLALLDGFQNPSVHCSSLTEPICSLFKSSPITVINPNPKVLTTVNIKYDVIFVLYSRDAQCTFEWVSVWLNI